MGGEFLYNIGDVVNSRYEIVRHVGKGATGEVFEAFDKQLRRQIAIKYLKWIPGKTESLNQFKTEFATLTHLSHPHIAKVYDFEQDLNNHLFFFTSEFIEGMDFVKATHGRSVQEIEELFVQTLRALEYLHGNGIYHFDIKSANVLISSSVKIIDFGLATIRFQGRLVGTPSYMAPEMINRDNPDSRADLYSLGVLVYSALTGVNPFRSQDSEETIANQLKLVPKPPSATNPKVPPYLDAVIMRLLEKKPADRFQTAAQVIKDISLRSRKKYSVETSETKESYIPLESKFIGRGSELSLISNLFKAKHPRIIIVCGKSGTGKSRFLNEIKYLAQVSEWSTLFFKEVSKTNQWQKSVLKKFDVPTFIGIDDFDKLQQEVCGYKILKACETLAERILANEPVILAIGLSECSKLPKSLQIPSILKVGLKNFTIDETRDYLTALTGLLNPPQNIVRLIFDNTEGNPFILTEVIKSLVDSGMLVDTEGRWKETTFEDIKINLSAVKIEPDLEKRLLSDFSGLPNDAKMAMEMLSVINRPVTQHEAWMIFDQRLAVNLLLNLSKHSLLKHNASEGTYFFAGPLLSKSIYGHMPEKIRMIWHDKIAKHTEGDELLYHTSRGSKPDRARQALNQLIEQEMAAQRNFEAIEDAEYYLKKWNEPEVQLTLSKLYNRVDRFEDAIRHAEEIVKFGNGEIQIEAQICIGNAFLKQKKFDLARQNFIAALQMASEMPVYQQLRIQNFLADVSSSEGKIEQSLEIYQRTEKMAEDLPVSERLKIKNNNLGEIYFKLGDYKKATEQLEKDSELYKYTDDTRLLSKIHYMLAEAYRISEKPEKSREYFMALIEHAKKAEDLEHLFRGYNGLGNLYNTQQKFKEAREYYERALDICSRLQMDDQAITCIANLGLIESDAGELKNAYDHLSQVLAFIESGRASGFLLKEYHGRMHLELGDICRANKNFEEAKKHLNEALEVAKETGNRELIYYSYKTLARMYAESGDKSSATECEDKASVFVRG